MALFSSSLSSLTSFENGVRVHYAYPIDRVGELKPPFLVVQDIASGKIPLHCLHGRLARAWTVPMTGMGGEYEGKSYVGCNQAAQKCTYKLVLDVFFARGKRELNTFCYDTDEVGPPMFPARSPFPSRSSQPPPTATSLPPPPPPLPPFPSSFPPGTKSSFLHDFMASTPPRKPTARSQFPLPTPSPSPSIRRKEKGRVNTDRKRKAAQKAECTRNTRTAEKSASPSTQDLTWVAEDESAMFFGSPRSFAEFYQEYDSNKQYYAQLEERGSVDTPGAGPSTAAAAGPSSVAGPQRIILEGSGTSESPFALNDDYEPPQCEVCGEPVYNYHVCELH
ncbi:hypothetical protein PQX77_010667 [Marasmius sp. AFHP31]|nr:hypothetical protein PQX77_010667 [Marasmius sp. AFHP31]